MPPARPAASDSLFSAPDWSSLGLILAIVGCFLVANSILFRDPQALVRAHFKKSNENLRTLREYVFHRVQITLGFTYLLAGFALQLCGRLVPGELVEDRPFPILWIGLVVVLTVALQVCGWYWSLYAFRRYVRAFFAEHPPDFENNAQMAREVGGLFGLDSFADDTVQSYAARLRSRLRIPVQGRFVPRGKEQPELEET